MFALVQAFFWLALATWYGAAVFAAVVPPIILRVVRREDPTLPRVLSVNLQGQHSTLLSGTIVAEILQVLFRIEVTCAGVLLAALIGQWLYVDRDGMAILPPVLRSALFITAVAILIYNWRVLWPSVIRHRDRYIEHADDPDIANAELDHFDRQSATAVLLLQALVFVLTGLVFLSASVVPDVIVTMTRS